jgi:DNA-binding transcriptional regulator YdaS (Cro superfamily)
MSTALEKIIEFYNGNLTVMARDLGVRRSAINYWRDTLGCVPEAYALKVQRLTDRQVSAEEILYDAEQAAKKRKRKHD